MVCGSATRWAYKSRSVHVISERFDVLESCFQKMAEDEDDEWRWDNATLSSARGFLYCFQSLEFRFFLELFDKILAHVDVLYNIFQAKATNVLNVQKAVDDFLEILAGMRTDEKVADFVERAKRPNGEENSRSTRSKLNLKHLAFEVIDTITVQIRTRFGDCQHLGGFQLLDSDKFVEYNRNFPQRPLPPW